MPNPTTKTALIETIKTERQRLLAALDGLSDPDLIRPGQNGDLSVKDTLAHIATWEQECLGWYRAGLRGEMPERPDPDDENGVNRYNRAIYEQHRDRSLADVRALFEQSYRTMLDAIDHMTESEIFSVGRYEWTDDEPLVNYIRANTDEHYAEHADEITRWRREQNL
jgi:hypothetical protein